MSIRVGVTALKLSNKPSSKSRKVRTGKLRAVACEALKERYGHDRDIDATRTALNTYEGITSGQELHRVLTEEAEEYSRQRKAAGGRALRAEAAIGFVSIVKPHVDDLATMTLDQQERFIRDANDTLDGLLCKKPRARAVHYDEQGIHSHNFYDARTADGRICVDEIVNPALFRRLNVDFITKMREKGWDVEPHELYDAERAERDPEYAETRRQRRREHGRDSGRYKADQDARHAAARDAELRRLEAREARQAQVADVLYDKRLALDDERQAFEQERAAWLREREAQEKAIEARRKAVETREAVLPGLATAAAKDAVKAEIEAARREKRRPVIATAERGAAAQIQAAMEKADAVRATSQGGKTLYHP